MTHTTFYFSPTGQHERLDEGFRFNINRFAVGDSIDQVSSEIRFDIGGNVVAVVFEGDLDSGQRKKVIDNVTTNLPLQFEGYEPKNT